MIILVIAFFFNLYRREQAPQTVDDKGGPQLSPRHIRHRIADCQSVCRLRQSGIKILQFDAHAVHARGRQLNAPLGQLVPVVVVQDAAALARVRQYMVVGPQEEQVLVRMPVIPGNFADGHLVQGYRDGANAVLGHHLAEQPGKFVQAHGFVA